MYGTDTMTKMLMYVDKSRSVAAENHSITGPLLWLGDNGVNDTAGK